MPDAHKVLVYRMCPIAVDQHSVHRVWWWQIPPRIHRRWMWPIDLWTNWWAWPVRPLELHAHIDCPICSLLDKFAIRHSVESNCNIPSARNRPTTIGHRSQWNLSLASRCRTISTFGWPMSEWQRPCVQRQQYSHHFDWLRWTVVERKRNVNAVMHRLGCRWILTRMGQLVAMYATGNCTTIQCLLSDRMLVTCKDFPTS